MKELLKGTCQFTVIEDQNKEGKDYKRFKLKFSDYYEKDFCGFVNDESYAMLMMLAKQNNKD